MSLLSHWPIDSVFFVWFKQICSPLIERESVTPTDWESQSQDSPSRLSSLIFRASLVDHFDRLNFETQNCGMTTNCVSVKLNPKWTSDYCNNRVLHLCRWINESRDEYTKKKTELFNTNPTVPIPQNLGIQVDVQVSVNNISN